MEKGDVSRHIKEIDTREYVSALREMVQEGKTVGMLIAGSSMSPFLIHGRDFIYFKKPDRELKKGDIVFYQRENGRYVVHRIYRIKDKTGYYMIGDGQNQVEGPLKREQIFALVTSVKRKGKVEQKGDFWWEFFEHIWIHMVLFRKPIQRFYSLTKKVIYCIIH